MYNGILFLFFKENFGPVIQVFKLWELKFISQIKIIHFRIVIIWSSSPKNKLDKYLLKKNKYVKRFKNTFIFPIL